MFDMLTYANKLKEAGLTEKQAETIATTQAQIINEQLVTREHFDFRILELELKFEGRFLLVNWMLGFVLAGILSLVAKAFFAH